MSGPPHIVVLSSLFPNARQPGAGLFIRERMFRVGQYLPLCVVAPTPWFPLQSLIRLVKPGFRPGAPRQECQSGFSIFFPRYFSIPGLLKKWDGFLMAVGAWPTLRRLKAQGRLDIIDAHFAFPDGYAAHLLGRWLDVPYTVTMRGTETRHLVTPGIAERALTAIKGAARVFAVANALKSTAVANGVSPEIIEVVGNGVDIHRFTPIDRAVARAQLGILPSAKVMVSVGGLVPRKGFHRVIEILPRLLKDEPSLQFVVVGGASPEGNIRDQLESQVKALGLEAAVRFTGPLSPQELPTVLSAADIFVLATSNEGWANVFLEAMACGLPVVTTDVGGNPEVVSHDAVGCIAAFGDQDALLTAIRKALVTDWDRPYIRQYAQQNTWDERVNRLCQRFNAIAQTAELKS